MKYIKPQDYTLYVWNEEKKKDRVALKLLQYYKKNKRMNKITKLIAMDSHWKGLS